LIAPQRKANTVSSILPQPALPLAALRLAVLPLAAVRLNQSQQSPGLPEDLQNRVVSVLQGREERAHVFCRVNLQLWISSWEAELASFSEWMDLPILEPDRQTSRFLAPGHLLADRRTLVVSILLDRIDDLDQLL
jgi:hypothetical protein